MQAHASSRIAARLNSRNTVDLHRARKVKCDELKPVCARCRSTGRVCDGYGIWGGGGNGYAERYCKQQETKTLLQTRPPSSHNLTAEEGQHMQWFKSKAVRSISGFLGTDLWTDSIFPATWSEPAVTHAVIALSSAHRKDTCCRQGLHLKQDEEFTLKQYSKAIRHLQPLLTRKDGASIAVVLVTCLLFIFLEYTRGQHANAAVHLINGLKVLGNLHRNSGSSVQGVLIIKPPYKRAIDKALFQGFATLHFQARLFGKNVSDIALLLQATDSEIPTPIFESLEEARDSLYKLLHGILLMSERMKAAIASAHPQPNLVKAPETALAHLRMWLATYDKTIEVSQFQLDQEELAYSLLLNYHTMATIMCKSMLSSEESIYRNYTSDFTAIVRRFIECGKHHSSAQNDESIGESIGVAADVGWIPPLYYTALKCRSHRSRSHAIHLLRSVPHKEGVWDSWLAATVADKVRQLEEHGTAHELFSEADFALEDVSQPPFFPETNFYCDVQVDLPEDDNVGITCRKRIDGQIFDVIRCTFDGEKWDDVRI
jgi:hypothetical protein